MTASSATLGSRTHSLDWLRTSSLGSDTGVAELAEHLMATHPELPCVDLHISAAIRPMPGQPTHSLNVVLADGDTAAVATWATTLGVQMTVEGACHTFRTTINGVGLRAIAIVPEDQYPMDAAAFTLTEADFGLTLHGVPLIELGEEGGWLVALGHVPARQFAAAVSAWPRAMYDTRYLPDPQTLSRNPSLAPQYAWGRGEAYPTRSDCRFSLCERGAPRAVPVTHVRVDGVRVEDRAALERCPACGRASRSTKEQWLPGRYDYMGQVHTCSRCQQQWPALDFGKDPAFHASSQEIAVCRACGCTDTAACDGGCWWAPNPLGIDLCSACYTAAPARAWEEMAAAGYGSPDSTPGRDSWLVIQAMRGVPVPEAAQQWATRIDTAV
ncbi:hypothetical protein ACFYOY_36085 [Streptomyces sp. NPDC007875]|uniref:hypothetical protein n=1 Tax=Streptomyces sp. NPDC007875 TaxID=3364783 RepID=UPI0036A139D2